jgi:nickel-dependent lactate racemase
MTKSIKIPWGAWYHREEQTKLDLPESWEIQVFDMNKTDGIKDPSAIKRALRNPIGTESLTELAKNKNNAAIIFEDISRPTKCEPILELLLNDLNSAGISDDNITLIAAVGSHRPMNRIDFVKKLGRGIVDRVNIENHHPYENLVELGTSNRGTPIYLNKTYYNAEVKIAISTVIPHPLAGFGGGAKIILPGICGIETLAANHEAALEGKGVGVGFITDLRKDIEEVCERVGLDFSVNIIATKNREIAGIFAGHFIDAHRKAIELGKKVYQTEIPTIKNEEKKFDIGLFNLYPEDTELTQSSKGNNLFMQAENLLKEESTIVFLTASPEGRGYHSLFSETGGKLYEDWKETVELLMEFFEEKTFAIYSPNLNRADIDHFWSEEMIFFNSFSRLIEDISKSHPENAKVALFPTSIQLIS